MGNKCEICQKVKCNTDECGCDCHYEFTDKKIESDDIFLGIDS
jgi:hypothetical protein